MLPLMTLSAVVLLAGQSPPLAGGPLPEASRDTRLVGVSPAAGAEIPSGGVVYVEVYGDRLRAEIHDGQAVWEFHAPDPVVWPCLSQCVFAIPFSDLGPAARDVTLHLFTDAEIRILEYRLGAETDAVAPQPPPRMRLEVAEHPGGPESDIELRITDVAAADDGRTAAFVFSAGADIDAVDADHDERTAGARVATVRTDCAACFTELYLQLPDGADEACAGVMALSAAGLEAAERRTECSEIVAAGCTAHGLQMPSLALLIFVIGPLGFFARRRHKRPVSGGSYARPDHRL